MPNGENPVPADMYWYTHADRLDQLATIASAGERIVALFMSGRQAGRGAYAVLVEGAHDLLVRPFEHDDLKELARLLPVRPPWLDPRNTEWNGPRGGWIGDVSSAYSDLNAAVVELRAIGSF